MPNDKWQEGEGYSYMAFKSGYIIAIGLGALVVAALLSPQIRQLWLNFRAEEVEVPLAVNNETALPRETLDLKIITILGKDGIPAILDPQFVSAAEAAEQMLDSERVLGVSINGDHRAYALNQLSRHEIVNDEVGGVPVAVTW
jgi:hypothetical protein